MIHVAREGAEAVEQPAVEEQRVGLLHLGTVFYHLDAEGLVDEKALPQHRVGEKVGQSLHQPLASLPLCFEARQEAAPERADEGGRMALKVETRNVGTDGVELALLRA